MKPVTTEVLTPARRFAIEACCRRMSRKSIRGVYESRGGAYTDGKSIYLPMADGSYTFIDLEALAVHESGHIRFRSVIDPDLSKVICPENPKLGQIVMNIVEDRRIETLVSFTDEGYFDEIIDLNIKTCTKIVRQFITLPHEELKLEDLLMLTSLWGCRSIEVFDIMKDADGKFLYTSESLAKYFRVVFDAFLDVDSRLSFPATVLASKKIVDALRDYIKETEEEGEGKGEGEPKEDEDEGEGEPKEGEGEGKGKPKEGEGEGKGKPKEGEGKGKEKGDPIKDFKPTKEKEEDKESGLKPSDLTPEERKAIKLIKGGKDKEAEDLFEKLKEKMEELTDISKVEEMDSEEPSEPMEMTEGTEITPHGDCKVKTFKSVKDIESLSSKNDGISECNRICLQNKPLIEVLKARFKRLTVDQQYQRGHITGKICARDLPTVITTKGQFIKPFKAYEKGEGADIIILIDESGSMMGSKIEAARKAAIILAEATEGTKIRLCIIGFGAADRSLEIDEKIYKDFDEKLNPSKIGVMAVSSAYHQNRDGTSFRAAAKHFEGKNKKFLIILSDGEPYHPSGKDVYTGNKSFEDCRKAIAEFKKRYIETYCVSIDFGKSNYLETIYERNKFFPLKTLADIRPLLIRLVTNMTRI